MRRWSYRWLCLMMVLLVALPVLPALAEGTAREPIILTMYKNNLDTVISSLDDPIGKEIYEQLGIEIQWLPYNESQYEKALMMLAAQDWGELDFVTTANDEITKKYIEAGAFVNLDDYRDKLPNFYSYEVDLIPYWRLFDTKSGGLYVWQAGPDQIQMTSPPLDVATRIDALEACGWPDLDTTDDYIAFLKEASEKIPMSNGMPTIGMSSFYGDPVGPLIATYLPRHSGMQHFYEMTGLVDVENGGKIVPMVSHPYFKEGMRFYNTLFREGLLDPEFWTDGFAECQAKADSGMPLTVMFMNWVTGNANVKAIERGEPNMQYIVTPIRLSIAKEEGKNNRYEIFNALRGDETVGVLAKSPHVERIMDLINFLAREEITIRAGWGDEGADYVMEGDRMVCTPEFLEKANKGADSAEFLRDKGMDERYLFFPTRLWGQLPNGQAARFGNDPAYKMASSTPEQLNAYDQLGWDNLVSGWSDNPNFKFMPFDITNYIAAAVLDPDSPQNVNKEKIKQYMDRQIPLLINAATEEEFESIYQQMVTDVEGMGLQEILDIYNANLGEVQGRLDELAKK